MSMRPGQAKGPSVSPDGGSAADAITGTLVNGKIPVASGLHTLVDSSATVPAANQAAIGYISALDSGVGGNGLYLQMGESLVFICSTNDTIYMEMLWNASTDRIFGNYKYRRNGIAIKKQYNLGGGLEMTSYAVSGLAGSPITWINTQMQSLGFNTFSNTNKPRSNFFDMEYESSDTALLRTILSVAHMSTGTPLAGLGPRIELVTEQVGCAGTSVAVGALCAETVLYGNGKTSLWSLAGGGLSRMLTCNHDQSIEGNKFKVTPEGGYAIKLLNRTGVDSVKGTVVAVSSNYDNTFMINPIDGDMPIGIVYDDSVADGSYCWIVVTGIAQVLLVNSVATTRSYIGYSSATVAGRIDTAATVPVPTTHFREIGHTLESATGGNNRLVKCIIHFN